MDWPHLNDVSETLAFSTPMHYEESRSRLIALLSSQRNLSGTMHGSRAFCCLHDVQIGPALTSAPVSAADVGRGPTRGCPLRPSRSASTALTRQTSLSSICQARPSRLPPRKTHAPSPG